MLPKPLPIRWYWPSEEEFFNELAELLGRELQLTWQHKYEVRELISRFSRQLAKTRSEIKKLVAFTFAELIELRFEFVFGVTRRKVRLITSANNCMITILAWHVKNETNSELSRELQNAACNIAVQRLRGMSLDNPSR